MSKDNKPSVAPEGKKTRAASAYRMVDGERVRVVDDHSANKGATKGSKISNFNNIYK